MAAGLRRGQGGELVDHGQALGGRAVGASIVDEVIGPHGVGPIGERPHPRPRADLPPRPAARQGKASMPPQPVDPFRIDREPAPAQQRPHAPVAVARMGGRQALQLRHERRIAARPPRRVAQGRARHPQQRTRPPAREPAGHRVAHLGAADRYALHFFALISFSTSSSSSRSASSPFKRAFSRSRRLSRMASVSVRPPYFLRHR